MKSKILLHMHQLRSFIDDRHSFYNEYFNGIKPASNNWKGVQNAFKVGSAVDYGIKRFYLNLMENKDPEENVLDSQEFKSLTTKYDQVLCSQLIYGYISKYHDNEDTKEYFQEYKIVNWNVPFIFSRGKKHKNEYIILASPDVVAVTLEGDVVIIEIKTSGEDSDQYSAETLDFQTMTYAWASYQWNRKVPKNVIKRTLMKPRIKQKKDETEQNFLKRLTLDIAENPDYFKSTSREMNLDMIKEYHKYLTEILLELDSCLNSNNKYKFWKTSREYWGI